MAFSDFKTLQEVANTYNISLRKQKLFPNTSATELPAWLLRNLERALLQRKTQCSEYYMCEFFIAPLLGEVIWRYPLLNFWSHEYVLAVDDMLKGTPDYLVSYMAEEGSINEMKQPLLVVAEAKKSDYLSAWSQTLSEMIACQKLNDNPDITVYGIATDGISWEFAQLKKNVFTQDSGVYSLSANPQQVAGIVDIIFKEGIKQMEQAKPITKN